MTTSCTQRGIETHYWYGWPVATQCHNALCSDGKRRCVTLTREADTFFTIPGSVKVRGKTVTGFIAHSGSEDDRLCAYAPKTTLSFMPTHSARTGACSHSANTSSA